MNPYLKPTSLSPSTKFSSHLAQSTSAHPLTESTYYTPSNTLNSNYSPYASRVDDQAHYRGGHGVSRTDFSASMGSRPVNLRSSHADFAPSSTTTATVYTVNTRPQGSGRSSSIEPGVSTFHDSTLRSDSYSKMYKPVGPGVTNAGIVHRPATLEQPEVKPSYTTTQRTAADHKANLEKLQAIIDAAKARQLASGIPRPEQDRGASNYASETRVYTPGVVGFSDTPTSYSSVGLEKTLSSQYKSVGYSGQALNYPSSADKYAVMRSSGIGGSLQPSKDVTSTSSVMGHTPAQSSTPLYSYSAGLSAKLDHVQPMAATTPTLRQYESAISGVGAINGGRLSNLSDESKGFSFRDPLSQEGRRLSGNASATSFGTVQAAPKEATGLNVQAQKVNVMQSPPERLVKREQNNAVEVPNLSSPLRRYQLEDRAYENGLLSATSESSISKKTFYSIEGTNNAALKAFKSTVAELSQRTPEKNKTTLADVQSPFEDLQFALNRDNVQISRIIIETVENYSSRESPYKRGGADSQRGEVEPPIIPLEPKKVVIPVNVVEEPRKASVSTVEETKKTPIIEPRQPEPYKPHHAASPSGAEILKTYIKQPPLEEKIHSVAPQPTEQKKVTTSELSQFESGQKVLPSKSINETPKTELRPSVEHRKSSQHSQPVEEPSHGGHGVISQIATKVEHAKDHASSLLARIDSALARSQTSVEESKQGSERRQSGASGLEQFETNREKPVTKTVHETPKTEPRPIAESARPINVAQFEPPSRPVESESSRRESQKTEIKPSLPELPKSNNQAQVDDYKPDLSRKLDLPLQYQEPRPVSQAGNKEAEREVPRPKFAVEQPRKEVPVQGWQQAQSEKESENRYVPSKDLSDKILDSRRESSVGADSRNDMNALTNQKIVGTMIGMNERLRSFEEFANQVEDQPAPVSDHRPTPSITNDEYKPSIANADVETISRADSRSDTFKSTVPAPEAQKSKFVEQSVKSEQEEEEKSYPEPVTDFGASQNVISHREVLTKEPEPQLVSSKPESVPKKVVTPEVGTATEEVKKKSSNLAVKAMIGFLVVLLLGLLGMELVSGSGDA